MRLVFLLLVLLAGCASVPVAVQRAPEADAPFAFNGRVAVRQGERRESAGLRWVHRAVEDEILLLAPWGRPWRAYAAMCRRSRWMPTAGTTQHRIWRL